MAEDERLLHAAQRLAMLSKRFGFDPALTAGPFATARQDVLATALLHWLT